MGWSATQYTKFENERTRPVRDLLAQLDHAAVCRAADIGCGPGNSTELLKARFPQADVIGVDSSQNMIAAARRRLPALQFEIDDITHWQNPGPFDVILANAALQWVGDHEHLLPALLAKLAPGGQLVVQIPNNWNKPALALMRETAMKGPWAGKLAHVLTARAPRYDADWYYRTLRERVSAIDLWETTYFHILAGGVSAITEWFKGSGLRLYLDALGEAEQREFVAAYEAALAEVFPVSADGTVILPFPRLFFIAGI